MAGPEFAPIHKWTVTERLPESVIFASMEYTLQGRLAAFVYKEAGEPVRLTDFRYSVIIKAENGQAVEERLALLLSLHGKVVALCDSNHANNGTSHALDVRKMFFEVADSIEPINNAILRYNVKVTLRDASRIL